MASIASLLNEDNADKRASSPSLSHQLHRRLSGGSQGSPRRARVPGSRSLSPASRIQKHRRSRDMSPLASNLTGLVIGSPSESERGMVHDPIEVDSSRSSQQSVGPYTPEQQKIVVAKLQVQRVAVAEENDKLRAFNSRLQGKINWAASQMGVVQCVPDQLLAEKQKALELHAMLQRRLAELG